MCVVHATYRPVQSIQRGDRAGICVTQLNPKLVERGLAAAPGSVPTFSAAVAVVDKVRFYAGVLQAVQRVAVVGFLFYIWLHPDAFCCLQSSIAGVNVIAGIL